MTNLFVIILNFNNQKVIIPCLESLIKAYPKVNIIVVDNVSTDGSLQSIKNLSLRSRTLFFAGARNNSLKYERLKIIKNERNLGFAGGVNIGIKLALKQGAEAVLLLNPDTIVNSGFLEPLLANPAEIVGPILKFQRNGQWVYDFGGKINWWLGRTTHIERTKNIVHSAKEKNKIDYVSGCCMLIRRKVFEKIGFLNERYFLFFEDPDFCLRAKKAGLKVALEPKSMILHKLSEGKAKPWRYFYHLIRNNLIFINTWVPFYRRPIAYLYLWLLAFKMLLNRF